MKEEKDKSSSKRRFRFSLENGAGPSERSVNKWFLSSQKTEKNRGSNRSQVNATIHDVVSFLSAQEGIEIVFDVSENLYKLNNIYYTKNQLLFRANKMRKYLGLKIFILD